MCLVRMKGYHLLFLTSHFKRNTCSSMQIYNQPKTGQISSYHELSSFGECVLSVASDSFSQIFSDVVPLKAVVAQ